MKVNQKKQKKGKRKENNKRKRSERFTRSNTCGKLQKFVYRREIKRKHSLKI